MKTSTFESTSYSYFSKLKSVPKTKKITLELEVEIIEYEDWHHSLKLTHPSFNWELRNNFIK